MIFNKRIEFDAANVVALDNVAIFLVVFVGFLMWVGSTTGIWFSLSKVTVCTCVVLSALLSLKTLQALKEVDMGISTLKPLIWAMVLILMTIFFTVIIPPFTYDEVAYSVALPRDYASAGYFFYNSDYGPYSAFPQNYEAITTLSMIITGSPILSKTLNFFMGLGIVFAITAIAKFSGVARWGALISAALVFSSSVFLANLPVAKNDIANAYFQLWSIVFVLFYSRSNAIIFALLAAGALGTSIGIKYNSLIFSIVPISIFIFTTLRFNLTLQKKAGFLLLFFLTLIFFATPWYLKNWLMFANPVYPVANDLFGAKNSFNSTYTAMFKEMFYFDIPNFSWHSGTLLGFFSKIQREFGFGIIIMGISGLVFDLFKPKNQKVLIVALTSLSVLFVSIRFGFWEPRYLIVLMALFGIHGGSLIVRGMSFLPIGHAEKYNKAICYLLMLFAIKNCIGFFGPIQYKYFTFSTEEFASKKLPGWTVASYLNRIVPVGEKIAVGFGTNQMFYYLHRPYYHIHPLTEKNNLICIKSGEDLYKLLMTENVKYLAISGGRFRPRNSQTPLLNDFCARLNSSIEELFLKHRLEKITFIDDVIIYKVNGGSDL